MKIIIGFWIILSVVWWLLALNEAKRDRFHTTHWEAVWMLGIIFLILPFALASVIVGGVQGIISILSNKS